MDDIYELLVDMPFDSHGWFGSENRKNLKWIIKDKSPKIIVELGSWLGLSARFMADLLPEDGRLYAIDIWLALNPRSAYAKNAAWASKLPALYQQFLSNLKHCNLTKKVIPVRMTTQEAANALNVIPDLIYVDASHEEEDVYADILSWYPKLSKTGIMCGDDYATDHPGVIAATRKAAKELDVKLCNDKRFWWFESIDDPQQHASHSSL
jgi:predicted O-methyltransferase YrrM